MKSRAFIILAIIVVMIGVGFFIVSGSQQPAPTVQAEPIQVEPIQVEPIQVEPIQVEPIQVEPIQVEPVVSTLPEASLTYYNTEKYHKDQAEIEHLAKEILKQIEAFERLQMTPEALEAERQANRDIYREGDALQFKIKSEMDKLRNEINKLKENGGNEIEIFAREHVLTSYANKLQELKQLLKDFEAEDGRENLKQYIDELKL